MNKIIYEDYMFDDNQLKSGTIELGNSMVAESLSADTMTFSSLMSGWSWVDFLDSFGRNFLTASGEQFRVREFVDKIDLSVFEYGKPLYYYKDNTLISKLYFRQFRRVPTDTIEVDAISVVGMLAYVEHMGGIYNGARLGDVVADMLSGYDYTIDADVANVILYGWLPVSNVRDNLLQVMFSCGASILKDDGGTLHIGYNQPETTGISIPGEVTFIDGASVDYMSPATKVTVTEHTYLKDSATDWTILYDTNGIALTHDTIVFSGPYFDIEECEDVVNGNITLHEYNANYAVISGTGVLQGKSYTHITRNVAMNTGVTSEINEKSVSDATLVNQLNINNVLARVASYYSLATQDTFECAITDASIRPGTYVLYTNALGEDQRGYVKNVTYTISNELRARIEVATSWKPNHLGNSFTESLVITADSLKTDENGNTYYEIPEDYRGKPAMLALFGAGSGGGKSEDGKSGEQSQYSTSAWWWAEKSRFLDGAAHANGGEGGEPGTNGRPGKFINIPINALESKYFMSFGVGGLGETASRAATEGTESTFGVTSPAESTTENGTVFDDGYVNMVTGEVYAKWARTPLKGGKGGDAGYDTYGARDSAYNGRDGEDVGSHFGGSGALFHYDDYGVKPTSGVHKSEDFDAWDYGSGGGGASGDNDGVDASPGMTDAEDSYSQFIASYPGKGGDATDCGKAEFAGGGAGAHGGGGGGAIGITWYRIMYEYRDKNKDDKVKDYWLVPKRYESTPGKGANGGDGGDGFAVLYV